MEPQQSRRGRGRPRLHRRGVRRPDVLPDFLPVAADEIDAINLNFSRFYFPVPGPSCRAPLPPVLIGPGVGRPRGDSRFSEEYSPPLLSSDTLSEDSPNLSEPLSNYSALRGRPSKKGGRGGRLQSHVQRPLAVVVVPAHIENDGPTQMDIDFNIVPGPSNAPEVALPSSDSSIHTPLFFDHPVHLPRPVFRDVAIEPMSIDSSSDSEPPVKRSKRGRPVKRRRGRRPTLEGDTRQERNTAAVRRFEEANAERVRETNRAAVVEYSISNPDVNRGAVSRYLTAQADRRRMSRAVHERVRFLPACMRDITADARGVDLLRVPEHRFQNVNLNDAAAPKCPHCQARFFKEELTRANWCCRKGKLSIEKLPPLSANFYEEADFQKNSRTYNNLFLFSSLYVSGKFCKFTPPGVSFVKVQGRTYHKVYDLGFQHPTIVNNSMLYINDEDERLKVNPSVDPIYVRAIQRHLNERNPFVGVLRSLALEPSVDARIEFPFTDKRLAAPTASEIAALVVTGPSMAPRKVAIWKIGESRSREVHYLSDIYEPLQYPILFPEASRGWSANLRIDESAREGDRGNKITQAQFYRMRLLSDQRFQLLRRLGQEYIVDMVSRMEEETLNFYRRSQEGNQRRLATRRELQEFDDETIAGGQVDPVNPGRVYLSRNFTHSPRWFQVKYHEAMAICARLGNPTYFITFTCNPSWEEIQKSLLPGQIAADNPIICSRVFHLKLLELKRWLVSGVFGELVSLLYVVEYQKRGLPHAHIAIKVTPEPTTSEEIDRVVRADIPSDDEAGGRLRSLVLKHMIHGQCGISNPNAPCMDAKSKKCSKLFPKPIVESTYTDARGYVHYKRPHMEQNIRIPGGKGKRSREVNNTDVVPFNSILLLRLNCHCNVEITNTVGVVKYLYKYIYKGTDRVNVEIHNESGNVDEITDYVNMRYLSASACVDKILENDSVCRMPSVQTLPIHLPGEDSIVFRVGEEAEAISRSVSLLNIYLARPADEELDRLTYIEFFEQYVVEARRRRNPLAPCIDHPNGTHFIYRRQKRDSVARIHFISPTLGELFFLRHILTKVPVNSFEDIRTVDGVVYPTFQEAARARGLLLDDEEFREALREASVFKTGRSLRQFYFALLFSGAPVGCLWDEFKDLLCEDHIDRNPDDLSRAYTLGLCDLDRMLRVHGKTLTMFGLPSVPDPTTELGREQTRWSEAECSNFADDWEPQLSADQKSAFDLLTQVANDPANPGGTYFIIGCAGSGKTLLLNVLTAKLRSQGHVVLCTASTGIAALNHQGGTTAHSMFSLPTDPEEDTWKVSNTSQRGQLIRKAKLIIYDEAPMVHRDLLEILNRGLKDLCNTFDRPFGGKLIVFAGDFRQIPPVIPHASSDIVVRASIKFAPFWSHVKQLKLTSCQRTRDDPDYSDILLAIGEGRVTDTTVISSVPVISIDGIPAVFSFEELIDFVYPSELLESPDMCCTRAILTGTNRAVRVINTEIFQRLPHPVVHCYSTDKLCNDSDPDRALDINVLNSFTDSGVPDHDLTLKVNAMVILMRNLDFTEGLVNGTKLIVVNISRRYVEVRKPNQQTTLLIPRISFVFTVGDKGPKVSRRQFPLKLAYGLTFNKSQGQTLDCVGVDLRSDVFSHGQLYVALGRVRSRDNIKVLLPVERVVDGVNYTYNIVYNDLIRD